MNIEKSIQIYLEWKESHTTVAFERYEIRLEQFKQFIGETTALRSVKGDDIVAYHKQMDQFYSPATVAYSARILRNFFYFWHGRREVGFNPKEIIPIRFINPNKDIVTKEDYQEMDELLDVNCYDDLKKKLVLHLLWDTGMRISELCDIELSHISEENDEGLRTAKVRSRKSMRYNLVVWGRETNELLIKFLGVRLCQDVTTDKLLINIKTGKPYTARSIQRWIKELADLAMLDKNITPHSFRHGKANYILDEGGSVRDVSAILRHVKPESSFHYMQLSTKRYLDVARKYVTA
ncbi:tyrosine-type recombinase/integrase [Flavivirga aquimarina]|uniref:Tyrosine-type recombinase/integrase n=1 Tax=Flavivirga aquimarina TaxID=2027862 RepID=A0ABT8W845_9FLAO|nr:tyrosine-type recombinase/integrase [Flavivirga aquimarina]MDO5969299.1 tyrosine-type recombinase/integrase [Flavivirga aquimarina]